MSRSTRQSPHVGPKPPWADWSDAELLKLRLCDLGLRMEDTVFPRRMEKLYGELARRGLRFRPHAWISEEWFSPTGIPGIAIPFFLAHPRLMKLEDRHMFEVEGGTESWFMRLLRHEAGHAIDTAFRLDRRKLWRKRFGSPARDYPDHYHARPLSRGFVRHLDSWYAQSHPVEDFAETFAVWLGHRTRWRRDYKGWPALRKLECVDQLMDSIAGKTAPVRSRKHTGVLAKNRTTLGEYYERKRAHYVSSYPSIPDPALLRLFSRDGGRKKAASFLRRSRRRLRDVVAGGTGEHPYTIDQELNEMIARCRELDLVVDKPEEQLRLEAAVLLSVRAMDYQQRMGRQWIPL